MADYSRFMKRHAQRLRDEEQRLLDEKQRNEKFRYAMQLMHPAGYIDTSKIALPPNRVEVPEPPPAMSRTLH